VTWPVAWPFDLGAGAIAWLALAAFGAAFVRGYSGFGFGALLIAAGALVVNPLRLVALAMLADLVMSAQMWRGIRARIDWRRAAILFAGAFAGLPLGLWALTQVSERAVGVVVALYVLAMGLVLLRGWVLRAGGRGVVLGTGVVSGAANAAGVGGLPVVALLAAQAIPPAVFRATLVAYFVLLDIWTLGLLSAHGLVTRDTAVALVILAPFFVAGTWAGSRRFLAAEPREFRRFAVILLIGLAIAGLVRAAL
jgi:uncharacterized protein